MSPARADGGCGSRACLSIRPSLVFIDETWVNTTMVRLEAAARAASG